jgi:hypothetical protein
MEEYLVLTSKSDLKNSTLERIIPLLANLYSYGFSQPRITQEEWSTTITLMLTDIALEIEIDWRDFDIFVLVVRLENGNLPSGYYVSEGRPCRYHLQKIISDRKWNVDQDALATISPENTGKRQGSKRSEDGMLNRFRAYKVVLDSCVKILVEEGVSVFPG